jgi:hypothetical protein
MPELRVGDPGFGVPGHVAESSDPEPPQSKGPDWSTFLDPKRWENFKARRRPPEFDHTPVKRGPGRPKKS